MDNLEVVDVPDELLLKVKSSANVQALAQAISHGVNDGKRVVLRAIGAGAVNQAFKAAAVASGYVAQRGLVLSIRPGFATVQMPDGPTSAMVMRVYVS
jgi:stage V sporulation protein S